MPKFKIVVAPPQIALCRSRVVIPSHVGKPDLGLHANATLQCGIDEPLRLSVAFRLTRQSNGSFVSWQYLSTAFLCSSNPQLISLIPAMDDWPWNWFPPTCSLLRLPMETLQDIANQLSATDLLVFCRVSRLTNVLSMKPLYREINMNTPSRTLLCCRTLRSNASAALHVRDLAVRW